MTIDIMAEDIEIGMTVVWVANAGMETETSIVTAKADRESFIAIGFDNSWQRSFKRTEVVTIQPAW
jgi:hypothetical protein